MTGGSAEKAALRERCKAARAALGHAERSRADTLVAAAVAALPEFARATHVFSYLSTAYEVDTRQLIRTAWSAGKAVALPRCIPGRRELAWHAMETLDGLQGGSFGILEPADDPATRIDPASLGPRATAVALVPGLAFDDAGFRLGYGGGYYDAFLPGFPGTSIGLCREAQMSPVPLPTFPTDVPVHVVATEQRIVRAAACTREPSA